LYVIIRHKEEKEGKQMIVKIETSCNFVGSETIHYIEFPDGTDESEISEYANDLLENDVAPSVYWEESSEEEAEENGYEVE
jgi:hypothetical protein